MHPTATRVVDGPSGRRILEGLAPYGAGYDGLVSVLADACAPASALELRGESAALEAFHAAAMRRVRAAAPVRHRRRRVPAARWSLADLATVMTGTSRPPVPARRAAPEVSVGPVIGSVLATAACAALAAFVYTVNAGAASPGGQGPFRPAGVSARSQSGSAPKASAADALPQEPGRGVAAERSQPGPGSRSGAGSGAGSPTATPAVVETAGTDVPQGPEAAQERLAPVTSPPTSADSSSPSEPARDPSTEHTTQSPSSNSTKATSGRRSTGHPRTKAPSASGSSQIKGNPPRRTPTRRKASVPESARGSSTSSQTMDTSGVGGLAQLAGAPGDDVSAAGHLTVPPGTSLLSISSSDECRAWQLLRGPFRVPVPVGAPSIRGLGPLVVGRDAELIDLLCSDLLLRTH